ncbi:MAG: hypothetical protein ACOC93_05565, partial [Planctomycetota bacterium]
MARADVPTSRLLIPVRRCQRLEGSFRWPEAPVLSGTRGADHLPLDQLAGDLRRRLHLRPEPDAPEQRPTVTVRP